MDKEYRIGCPENEKANLLASADLLNEKLNEVKQQGSVMGTERIAIMTALNMSHEILHSQNLSSEQEELNDRIDSLSESISKTIRDIQVV